MKSLHGQGRVTDAPNVFYDCQTRCYETHVRNELNFVNFVRDRQTSDVYLIITGLRTGSDGREYTIASIGSGRFEGMLDTIVFFTDPNITESDEQDLIARKVKTILLPYMLKTSLEDYIDVNVNAPSQAVEEPDDPWDYWVFRVGAFGFFGAEETSADFSLGGNMSVNRVTDESKFRLFAYFNHQESHFELEDSSTFVRLEQSAGGHGLYVKSITDHFSLGGFYGARSSTFENYDIRLHIAPAVEYNFFPYSEATRRQFTVLYRIGPSYNNYIDTTVFDQTEEWLWRHSVEIGYQQKEPWGQVEFWVDYGNFLHDWSLLSLTLNPELEWNITKGLNVNLGGRFSLIRDQRNISKSGATDEERLLRIKQLQTGFLVRVNLGLSYRFGSLYNNVVNVRF